MKTVYAIGGLGADFRVFSKLKLNAEIIVIPWLNPIQNETLSDYSVRMANSIPDSFDGWLIGVSFGGIIAQEISKFKKVKLVLISSATSIIEIPKFFRWVGQVGFFEMFPALLFKLPKQLAFFLFDAKNTKLLSEILDDTDPKFVKWALTRISRWYPESQVKSIRIHGKSDKLFQIGKGIKTDLLLNGGHFIIVDKGEEISEFLNRILQE